MKQKIINFLKGFGTIFLYILLTILGNLLLGRFYNSKNIAIATLSQIGTYLILLIGLALFYHKRLINDFKTFKKSNLDSTFRNWLIGLIIMVISNIIVGSIVKDIATNESLNRELLLKFPLSNIITMIFIGPLIEEITFRASFKDCFTKWYTFATITALLFGLAHIASWNLLEFLFIIPYGSLGFFFAKAFYETDNIYTSYLAHMFHNALCITIIFLI